MTGVIMVAMRIASIATSKQSAGERAASMPVAHRIAAPNAGRIRLLGFRGQAGQSAPLSIDHDQRQFRRDPCPGLPS